MKQNIKAFVIAVILGLPGILILNQMMQNSNKLTVSEVTDVGSILSQNHLKATDENDVSYYVLNDTKVFILDSRNAEQKLYTHSDVTAKLERDGTLNVMITDRAAYSEPDISGEYGVIIESENTITKVNIIKKG
ncbi:MAG: hypothetical protein K2P63_14070 [Lachnospiraceae bacterium]|nr:hypothetical protein [Lachnospiraceae bacterium]